MSLSQPELPVSHNFTFLPAPAQIKFTENHRIIQVVRDFTSMRALLLLDCRDPGIEGKDVFCLSCCSWHELGISCFPFVFIQEL